MPQESEIGIWIWRYVGFTVVGEILSLDLCFPDIFRALGLPPPSFINSKHFSWRIMTSLSIRKEEATGVNAGMSPPPYDDDFVLFPVPCVSRSVSQTTSLHLCAASLPARSLSLKKPETEMKAETKRKWTEEMHEPNVRYIKAEAPVSQPAQTRPMEEHRMTSRRTF